MRELTERERETFRREVAKDFPNDQTMQEVHFARLVHGAILRGASVRSRIAFYRQEAAKAFRGGRTCPVPASGTSRRSG